MLISATVLLCNNIQTNTVFLYFLKLQFNQRSIINSPVFYVFKGWFLLCSISCPVYILLSLFPDLYNMYHVAMNKTVSHSVVQYYCYCCNYFLQKCLFLTASGDFHLTDKIYYFCILPLSLLYKLLWITICIFWCITVMHVEKYCKFETLRAPTGNLYKTWHSVIADIDSLISLIGKFVRIFNSLQYCPVEMGDNHYHVTSFYCVNFFKIFFLFDFTTILLITVFIML